MAALARTAGGALLLLLAACPSSRSADDARAPCPSLDAATCARARGLAAAAPSYADVSRDLMLDLRGGPAAGAGLEQLASGAWRSLPACAERLDARPPKLDSRILDAAFVAVALDDAIVPSDADLRPLLEGGRVHRLRLVALAIARDLDPPFFRGTPAAADTPRGCACGRATHFVGAQKYGGAIAYEAEIRGVDRPTRAIEAVRAVLSDPRAHVKETRLGGLEVDGLDAYLAGAHAPRPLEFRLTKTPVPIAHAVYPIADACPLALPAPDVSPMPLAFGDATYGTEVRRALHVVNRAPIAMQAILGTRTFAIPARAAFDLPLAWIPTGDAPGCETQSREEMVVFLPQDREVPVTPKLQTVRVVERIRTGPPKAVRAEHVDTREGSKKPSFAAATRDWQCPPDFAIASCRIDHPQCPDRQRTCASDGYAITATQSGNGCHFVCVGPTKSGPEVCRFDAIMECQLRCSR